MGEDGHKTGGLQLIERLRHVERAVLGEFHQQVARIADGIALGMLHGIVNVFVGEMKVASQRKAHPGNTLPEFIEQREVSGAVVAELVIRMGSGDDMGHAVGLCHAAHLQRDLPGLCAVVDGRQQMAMNVDHWATPGWFAANARYSS